MPSPSPASRGLPEGGAEGSASNPSSVRAAAELIAVTTRDDFLLEMGETLTGQTAVRPVDSMATALEQIAGSRKVQLLAIDARDVQDLRADVEQLNAQAPHIVTLVFAEAEAEKQTAFALKGTNVFAVLPIPIDKRKTAAVLEGAIADAVARRPAAPAQRADRSSSIVVEPAPSPEPASYASSDDTGSGGRKPVALIGGGIAAALLIAGAAWYFLQQPAAPTPSAADEEAASVSISADAANISEEDVQPEAAPVVDIPLVAGTVDELLEKARAAMRERRYTEPANDNALVYYRSAATADPTNGEAQDGLRRVASVLSTRYDEAMAAGRYDEAALALAHLKAATPEDEQIKVLQGKLATAQITKMLAENNLERATALVKGAQLSGSVPEAQLNKWRAEISRRQEEARVARLVDLVQGRIREGRLSDPANDSAKAYLEQLEQLGPSAAAAHQRLARDLGNAYMRKAREAALANRGNEADRWLAEARSVGVSASELNAFQREMNAARQRAAAAETERLADLARDRLRENKLTEPANDSAAYYLTALMSADADHAYVATGKRELAAKLLERAGAAAREGKTAQMEADLAQARRWGADAKDIQAVQTASVNRRPATRTSSSAGSARANEPVDLQSRLKRIRYTPPEYPERALAQKITGSVTVEFTVSKDGEPIDVRVVAAEPAGTFDRAALSAVRRWRYEPVVIDNVPYEVPARTTIRFTLPGE
ncbi:MAG: energy transducer TonB [Steroidobacteraceae bacterium]|nr:energy transducer TonB [Steroidobacteraceae bacterium]